MALPEDFKGWNTYIGARYVPVFDGEWDAAKSYEPLTVVTCQGNSYTSKTFVAAGTPVSNETYWALTGNYNAQLEEIIKQLDTHTTQISDINDTLETTAPQAAAAYKAIMAYNFKTPDDFGAVGDGVTNDTAAFNQLFASGYNVFIPPKTYLINPVTIPAAFTQRAVVGMGPSSRIVGSLSYTAAAATNSYTVFSNFYISGRNLDVGNNVLTISNMFSIWLENVGVLDVPDNGVGFNMDNTVLTSEISMRDCTVITGGAPKNCVKLRNVADSIISGGVYSNHTSQGDAVLDFTNVSQTSVEGVHLWGAKYCVHVHSGMAVTFNDCFFDSASAAEINYDPAGDIRAYVVTNSRITTNTSKHPAIVYTANNQYVINPLFSHITTTDTATTPSTLIDEKGNVIKSRHSDYITSANAYVPVVSLKNDTVVTDFYSIAHPAVPITFSSGAPFYMPGNTLGIANFIAAGTSAQGTISIDYVNRAGTTDFVLVAKASVPASGFATVSVPAIPGAVYRVTTANCSAAGNIVTM